MAAGRDTTAMEAATTLVLVVLFVCSNACSRVGREPDAGGVPGLGPEDAGASYADHGSVPQTITDVGVCGVIRRQGPWAVAVGERCDPVGYVNQNAEAATTLAGVDSSFRCSTRPVTGEVRCVLWTGLIDDAEWASICAANAALPGAVWWCENE